MSIEVYRSTAKWLTHKTHQIAYWTSGAADKPAVLFLHGFPSASLDWQHQWQALSGDYQLIGFDFLGFGLSDKPQNYRYTLIEQADIAERVMREAGVQSCFLVAHDYGVSVAQELLARQLDGELGFAIHKLTWLNGGLFAEAHRPLLTQRLLASPLGSLLVPFFNQQSLKKSFTRIFGDKTPPKDKDIDDIWALLCEKQGIRVVPLLLSYIKERMLHRGRWVQAMQNAQMPLLFINGVQDPISGQHMLDLFIERVPDAEAVSLAVGHYPQLEAPDDITRNLLAFWTKN